MAQSPVMDSDCVQLTFKHNADELVAVKRMKKEPGALTAKSVVVLKNGDVTTRDDIVFMPNTIEMAQLKKPDKGQFKTNVQISSKMTEMDVKTILLENFPFLEHQRFWCAAAVDNRTRLDFHGQRRIWDGRAIKRKIKGNSALYIFTDEKSVDKQDPKVSEQLTLKRSHDQITTLENEKSEQASKREAAAENIPKHLTGFCWEKQAKIFPDGSSPKYVVSNPDIGASPAATETAAVKGTFLDKRGHLHPTEGQLIQHKDLDRVAEMESFVYVTGHPSKSVPLIQESRNAEDVHVVPGAALSSHSMPMGTAIMVQGGIVVAQPGLTHKIISTASDQQSLGKPVFHITDGHVEARHTGLPLVTHTVPHVMVSSTLTPRMSNLNISKAASLQLPKPVDVEKCTGKRDQSAQTEEGGHLSQHVLPETMSAKTDRSFEDELCKEAAAGQQHDAFRSLDQSKQSAAVNTQIRASNRYHEHVGMPASDRESQYSDFTDSGIDSLGDDTKEMLHRQEKKLDKLDEVEPTTSGISGIEKDGDPLCLLSDVASNAPKVLIEPAVIEKKATVTEKKSIVNEICPNRSSVKGGNKFMLVLDEHLPADVVYGRAFFGRHGSVAVTKLNEFNLVGSVPAADSPGYVTVKVHSLQGEYLGETPFHYEDEVEDLLQLLIRDCKLQARYFRLLAQELGNRTSETEKKTPEPSSFTNTGSGISGSRKNLAQQLLIVSGQLLKEECSWSANFPTVEPSVFGNPRSAVNESDYDSDDEASSTDDDDEEKEEDDDVCRCTGGLGQKLQIISSNQTDEIDNCVLHQELDGASKKCAFQFSEAQITQNATKPVTSSGFQCREQILEQWEFFSSLTTEGVAIKDNVENFSSNLTETEPDSCPLDSAVLSLRRKETEKRALVSQGVRKEASERSYMSGNTEIIHEQLSCVDLDENSVSDKTRRAHCVIKNNQLDDAPGADL